MYAWDVLESLGYTAEALLFELMQPCDKMISHCYWLNRPVPCESVFQVTKSSEGFCCSFNYRANQHLGLKMQSSARRLGRLAKKYRVSGAGEDVGMEMILHPEASTYQSYTTPVHGVKIIFHHPEHFVDLPPSPVIIQPGYFTKIAIAPSVLETDEDVRSLSHKDRKCIFPEENSVNFSSEYNFWACMTECRMRVTLELCKCIPFYYPHIRELVFRNSSAVATEQGIFQTCRTMNDTLNATPDT